MQGKRKSKSRGLKRGPAPFRPTAPQRKLVTLLAAGGLSEPGIAREIGICQNTLRKHFAEELRAGHEREIATNLRRLQKAADGGNVSAMKHLDAKFTLVAAAASFRPPAPVERPPPKLGKKEEAAAAATTAGDGSDWGDDLRTPGALPN